MPCLANFGPAVGQHINAAVPTEPFAPAASHSASLQQPDGLLWAGAPEDDPTWLHLPEDFGNGLQDFGDAGTLPALYVSGNHAFNPWSSCDTSSQHDTDE